jgi:hypothetical protein
MKYVITFAAQQQSDEYRTVTSQTQVDLRVERYTNTATTIQPPIYFLLTDLRGSSKSQRQSIILIIKGRSGGLSVYGKQQPFAFQTGEAG